VDGVLLGVDGSHGRHRENPRLGAGVACDSRQRRHPRHVLVVGGVLDNLPVDAMRATYAPARILAVDLRAPTTLRSHDLPHDGDLSGWAVARRRFVPWADPLDVPRLVDLLLVSSMVTGRSNGEGADMVLRPPVEGFGILDFASGDQLIDAGYRYAIEALETLDVRIPPA
jgi:predicted acylesterase/phospholipase RssA